MNYNSLPIISSIVVVVVVTVTAMIFAQGNNNIVYSLLLPSKQFSANALQSSSSSSFSLAQTIAIPNVNGRIDHMAIDVRGHMAIDVINLKAAKRIQSI